MARHSNKRLTVTGCSTANGAKLSQRACSGTAARSFRLTS
ncbi:RICIN domain-containing protein [Streptomyces sp. CACIS-1.16CA]